MWEVDVALKRRERKREKGRDRRGRRREEEEGGKGGSYERLGTVWLEENKRNRKII